MSGPPGLRMWPRLGAGGCHCRTAGLDGLGGVAGAHPGFASLVCTGEEQQEAGSSSARGCGMGYTRVTSGAAVDVG
jgi:hypothetical protein